LPRLGDVFVTASKTENQPLSILEALAFGLPVVGVRARGLPELVTDGDNGLLCEPDDPVDMARCMLRLVHEPSLRHRMSQVARASVANHTITYTVDMLEHIYRRAIWRVTHRVSTRVAVPGKSDVL
jgi:glycosyltransferase involved in cell wall biosynthesis